MTTTLATTFVDPFHLTAIVPSALLAAVGVASVTVVQPSSSASGALPFSVLAPTISTIVPASVPASGEGSLDGDDPNELHATSALATMKNPRRII